MSGSQIVLLISSTAFLGASGLVGLRLLWQAHQTRKLPELLMGLGLVCVIFVYLPIVAWSGLGRASTGEVKTAALAFGSCFMWLGFSCLFAFTWKTFRPDREWAMWLTFAMSSLMAASCGGMVACLLASPPDVPSFEAAKLWTGLVRVPMIVSFSWTSYEGITNHMMCRRRQALGLSDPVVTNRFLLWSIVGIIQSSINVVSLTLHVNGVGMMRSPTALFVVAFGSFVGSILMILTFFPPAMYLNLLRDRASGQEI